MPKLNDKGITHILVIFILLAGIIGGVFLVKNPAIFKPKAYQSDSTILQNQYDNPPPLLSSTSNGAEKLLIDSGMAAGYEIRIDQSEDEITINFEPQDLTEEQAIELLNNMDLYYLRMLMYLLLDTTNYFHHIIDPWYALCDKLTEDNLIAIEANNPPMIFNNDSNQNSHQMACSDPPPNFEQIDPTNGDTRGDRNYHFEKIPAIELARLVQWAKVFRETSKDPNQDAKYLALSMIPNFGAYIADSVYPPPPGTDIYHGEYAEKRLLNGLTTFIIGPVVGEVAGVAAQPIISNSKTLIGAIASKIGGGFIIPIFKDTSEAAYEGFAAAATRVGAHLSNKQSFIVKVVGSKALLRPNIRNLVIKSVGINFTREMQNEIYGNLAEVYGRLTPWAQRYILSLDEIQTAINKARVQGNFKVFTDGDYDVLVNSLGAYKSDGLTFLNKNPLAAKIAVRQSAHTGTEIHEAIHFVQNLHGLRDVSQADFMIREGLTDWLLATTQRGYNASYTDEAGQITYMVSQLNGRGVDGVSAAQYSALSGDTKYFLEFYKQYVGNSDMRLWFGNQFDIRRTAGLVPPLTFIQQMANENDTSVENPQITLPSEPTKLPLVGNYLNCSYSQEDSNCTSGTTICTGFSDDNQCSGKTPEECFNLVQCQRDENLGSSCSCVE